MKSQPNELSRRHVLFAALALCTPRGVAAAAEGIEIEPSNPTAGLPAVSADGKKVSLFVEAVDQQNRKSLEVRFVEVGRTDPDSDVVVVKGPGGSGLDAGVLSSLNARLKEQGFKSIPWVDVGKGKTNAKLNGLDFSWRLAAPDPVTRVAKPELSVKAGARVVARKTLSSNGAYKSLAITGIAVCPPMSPELSPLAYIRVRAYETDKPAPSGWHESWELLFASQSSTPNPPFEWTIDSKTTFGERSGMGVLELDDMRPLPEGEWGKQRSTLMTPSNASEIEFKHAKLADGSSGRKVRDASVGTKFVLITANGNKRLIEVTALQPGPRSEASLTLKISEAP